MAKSKEDSPVTQEGSNLDYTKVDQGQETQPALQETATVEAKIKKDKKGKKGKVASGGSVPTEFKTRREEIRCGFCGNPMTMSKEIHVVPIVGKKNPKREDGEPLYKSFGSSKSGLVGVLCDTCKTMSETTALRADGTSAVDIKTAIACGADGSIRMIPVGELPEA